MCLEIEEDKDVDIAYYVTSHELAHQWWAHQVMAANVQGSTMIIESLSQYSALMVMKREYSQEHMKEFLKEEVNRYLSGRTNETKRENPLATSGEPAIYQVWEGSRKLIRIAGLHWGG